MPNKIKTTLASITVLGLLLTFVTPANAGTIRRDYWSPVTGGPTIYDLINGSSYPINPSGTSELSSFEGPTNTDDWYGSHTYGYVVPSLTADYTFYIAGDDNADLFLSPNDNPYDRVLIATNATDSSNYTAPLEWNKYPSQASEPIQLVSGQRYFIEARQKEAYSNDNIAVGWNSNGGNINVIPGSNLETFVGSYPDYCPLGAQAGRIVVPLMDRTDDALIDNGSWEQSIVVNNDVTIPAGTYNITVATFDDRTGLTPDQDYEQVTMVLLAGEDELTSNPTPDLPLNKEWLISTVNTNFVIAEEVSTVAAIHSAYYNPNPHGVKAICAAFDLSSGVPPAPNLDFGYSYCNNGLPFVGLYYSANPNESGPSADKIEIYRDGALVHTDDTPVFIPNNEWFNDPDLNPSQTYIYTAKAFIGSVESPATILNHTTLSCLAQVIATINLIAVNEVAYTTQTKIKNGDILTYQILLQNAGGVYAPQADLTNTVTNAVYDPAIPNSFECYSCQVISSDSNSISFQIYGISSQTSLNMKVRVEIENSQIVTFETAGTADPGDTSVYDKDYIVVTPSNQKVPSFIER
ncbi:MAG: hypothetical protein A3I07_03870 [Candidatus Doudnabacteria bacterium RIFCSPLOWO2_02_FULL_42_9]|uniref:PA14 domain-containing protein n=1 Tax=Candidatus Doudnabacteria bacterium RIFCSPHIGHO2_01_FULL_41_86 TaxID=1817821 RepID=A0A1F5N7J6_9BACT|nr:MAG: hypothetical protein A2717_02985 [Candidatus Doudnabacteria bacterium RIFCSPHIGHO2_01_FULL_41_86]OGE74661.1 MAG: hypothetical protein A3K07_02580 [Candidatus Doudnabacteria bacterium RIFCSPHIGHO2_01_43_10]OGE85020.1 MAG: hypothetical protein A3E28_04390 [Candidatus Doudnabacteria bacterium RIFCSPHIGHO2_12_FULL_42_22]OGE86461.1 MAG: hypothetical protein A3C49_04570 [Candidatus Doudnabacteria bacterium RIFCSPHIGHO2_02_FULL_42_25]OGE91923.1 MAG: hypothetical protein A2895_01335 [Candidatus